MAEQGETRELPAGQEVLRRQIAAGVQRSLAPLVRAVSGCPVPEFADDPWGTIRTALDDLESLQRKGEEVLPYKPEVSE